MLLLYFYIYLIKKFSFHHRSLRQRNFPYRCGPAAQSSGSDLKRYFDFILSSVLHNTFETFEQQVNDLQQQQRNVSEEDSQKQFSTNCIHLAPKFAFSTNDAKNSCGFAFMNKFHFRVSEPNFAKPIQ